MLYKYIQINTCAAAPSQYYVAGAPDAFACAAAASAGCVPDGPDAFACSAAAFACCAAAAVYIFSRKLQYKTLGKKDGGVASPITVLS